MPLQHVTPCPAGLPLAMPYPHSNALFFVMVFAKKTLESLFLLLCRLLIHHCGEGAWTRSLKWTKEKKKPTDYMHGMKIPSVHRDLFGGSRLSPITSFLCVFGGTRLQAWNYFACVRGGSVLGRGAGRGAGPLAKQLPTREAVMEVLCPRALPCLLSF